jgi:hypothetical protein
VLGVLGQLANPLEIPETRDRVASQRPAQQMATLGARFSEVPDRRGFGNLVINAPRRR